MEPPMDNFICFLSALARPIALESFRCTKPWSGWIDFLGTYIEREDDTVQVDVHRIVRLGT
jgi:hypothetical protein